MQLILSKYLLQQKKKMKKLNKTPSYTLGEERSVGHINNELGIRGKENLEATSRTLLLNKSFDLLEKSDKLSKFTMFRKVAKEIKDMTVQWNEKMKKMEEEGNTKKDFANNKVSNVMYDGLVYLKGRNGPFTKPEDVLHFHENTQESIEKNKRLYVEVRYANNSCLSRKHTSCIIILMM